MFYTPLFVVALTATLAAQTPFARMPKAHVTATWHESSALADVDGDGDLDLVGANDSDSVLLNDGTGRFVDELRLGGNGAHGAARAGDFDGDGTVDLLFTSWLQDLQAPYPLMRMYRGLGGGRFATTPSTWPGVGTSRDAAVGDFDGDGDDDVVYADRNGNAGIAFAPTGAIVAPPPALSAVAAHDIDRDGDLDVVFTRWSGSDVLMWNDGQGRFTVDTTGALPATPAANNDLAFGDIDGDGIVDLVTAGVGSTNEVFLGLQGGRFRDATSTLSPDPGDDTYATALVDYDGDGDLDWLCGNGSLPDRIWINDGRGRFTDGTPSVLAGLAVISTTVLPGDVDGDGDVDLAWGGGGFVRLLLQDRAGQLVDATARRFESKYSISRDVAIGDLDGDGVDDAFVVYRRSPGQIFEGDIEGRFRSLSFGHLPSVQTDGTSVALGDVDGDGDLEIMLGTELGFDLLLFDNLGNGLFVDVTRARLPRIFFARQYAIELVDLDADGDLDAILGNGQGIANHLLRNVGGRFVDDTARSLPNGAGQSDTRAIAVGDVDADGDVDLFVAEHGQQDRLFLNDGTGVFTDRTATNLPQAVTPSEDAALVDLDGDHDLDLFVVAGATWSLCLNDGAGRFTDVSASRLPSLTPGGSTVVAADFDGDGTVDLAVAGTLPAPLLLANDGSARFTLRRATGAYDTTASPSALAAADPDGDGDADLIYVAEDPRFEAEDRMLVNRTRQVRAPDLARIGTPLEIEWHATWSATGGDPIVLPWFGVTAAPPLGLGSLGTLHLDPNSMIPGPAVAIPRVSGVRAASIPIPNDPRLLGAALYHQALFLHGPGIADWRLSGLLVARVVD